MPAAYDDCSCDSHELFDGLFIAGDAGGEKHLNKYIAMEIALPERRLPDGF